MASETPSRSAAEEPPRPAAPGDSMASRLFRRRNLSPPVAHSRQASVSSLSEFYRTPKDDRETEDEDQRYRIQRTYDELSHSTKIYGLVETRDGFFDSVFLPPEEYDVDELMTRAKLALPLAFRKKSPLSLSNFFPRQLHEVKGVVRRVTTTRAGIKLLKSFLAFFIAYILCLIPAVGAWLGRYSYIMVISALLNHSGRTVGAEVEGIVLTILGTATGLGWGSFGLWLSSSSASARLGYGGILALFLLIYIFIIAFIRSYYTRTYQMVICAGIAICYTCLAEVSGNEVSWSKLLAYGVPWCLGQAIAFAICLLIAPDAGSRALAVGLHQALATMQQGLVLPSPDRVRTRRHLMQTFVNLSQVYRDLVLDFSVTLFDPDDVLELRNRMQAVVRALLSLRTHPGLFDKFQSPEHASSGNPSPAEIIIEMTKTDTTPAEHEEELLDFVAENLAEPTETLLKLMRTSLATCDAVLMEMCWHRKYLGPGPSVSNNIADSLVNLRKQMIKFEEIQNSILESSRLPSTYGDYPEVVKLFAFCRPVHQAASSVEALLVKVNQMEQRKPKYPRLHAPTYPFWKSLHRTNAQVRHDRGGLTAGNYYRSFSDIAKMIQKIKSRTFEPTPRKQVDEDEADATQTTMTAAELEDESTEKKTRIGHQIWKVIHHLQGFETRFSLKTATVTSLLAIPAWLYPSSTWWDDYEIWWAPVMAWLIMSPRVGGNVQDLFARSLCGVLGAVWGGLAHAAGNGNPYVIAVFALIFEVPMIYRFTQSAHPRSGFVGCITFAVVSLAAYTADGQQSAALVAVTRGTAMVSGVVASVIVNWIIWPFVARHDLRKALSTMLFYCSIIYRSMVSRYVYYEEGHEPTKEDIENSEILEGRLRECFVRLRQLLALTRHELRLRAPFDPLPYSGLINSCERFFEYIVTVRQSSLFYHPHFIRDNPDAAARLIGYRRDAIAAVLTNLYVLAGALRSGQKVPKYLPNASFARAQLLEQMRNMEAEMEASGQLEADAKEEGKKWAQIYSYSYNESLTGCVEQLEELERYTKAIVGEQGFDIVSEAEKFEVKDE